MATETVQRHSTDTREAARRVARSKPQAVLLASSYATNASFIKNYRALDSTAQIFNLSFVGSNALSRVLPQHLRHGIGVMQVVPFPWDARLPVVRDYQMAMRQFNPNSNLCFSSLEGYMAAQYFIQALEQAGPHPTRISLMKELKALHNKDMGGFPMGGQTVTHSGSRFVELTFLNGQNGSFIH